METQIYALLVGIVAGLLGALCGVGGGIFMVPMFVTFFALGQKQAVATSLAVVIATALVATASNLRSGLVKWDLAIAAGIGAVAASWWGSGKMQAMSDQSLSRIFAVVMISVGIWMWFSPAGRNPR